MIKVGVSGAAGKMGKEVVKAVLAEKDMELVSAIDKNQTGEDAGHIAGTGDYSGVIITGSIKDAAVSGAEVVVDFTHPSTVMQNITEIVESGMHGVIGTTGISEENLVEIQALVEGSNQNIFIAPNFAIGAILMMELSKKLAKYMNDIEIIEFHHPQKADAPSGTAMKTANDLEKIISSRPERQEKLVLDGARGASTGNINIHSVRLPGYIAHQEVIFGGQGQTLTLRHDTTERTSFMPGVIMAIKAVMENPGLTYGLENLLEI